MDQLRAYIEALPEDSIPDLNESRARREHYQAEKAKLEALQGRGELVPVAEVRAEAFNLARSIRESMMAIPARLAPMLAGTADTRQCHHLLEQELRIALRVLSDG
jgi:phage terminase Nu1 subunit (DNA packaging protein)